MYSETPAPESCLPALSNSAKPTRLVPLSRIDTLGARTGPEGRLLMMSGSVRPADCGKSSALAAGCGWAGVLLEASSLLEPQPAATATGMHRASRSTTRREADRVTRGMGSREG